MHPNDHVNMGQSSNDVIPTAIHVAVGRGASRNELLPALSDLHAALGDKAQEFWDDHQDRPHPSAWTRRPIRLGQEFSGYARQVELAHRRAGDAIAAPSRNSPSAAPPSAPASTAHPDFARRAIAPALASETGIAFREAPNHFEAQGAKDGLVRPAASCKTIAVSLFKIANDIRWLGSGPRCGIGEISLPATQPGSSIMPGKVNPVMCESAHAGLRPGHRQRHAPSPGAAPTAISSSTS